ncbi:MAG: hypothetical protein QME42_09235 [bacterium]|nr:hypothetical protein [bacterium]
MRMLRYEILLPLKYNDGIPVEYEKIHQTKRELVDKFKAITVEPQTILGIWGYEEKEYEDELIRVIIDVENTSATTLFLAKYKEILKERFKQIDVWITASPIQII